MQINNIHDIINQFGLKSTDIPTITDELKKLRIELHPDKNGGDFLDDNHKSKYYDIEDSLRWLETNNTLVPLSQLTDLVRLIKDLDKPKEPSEKELMKQIESDLSIRLDKAKSSFSKAFHFPKIAVSTLTGIISFVWLFPDQLESHPILGDLSRSFWFAQAWLILFLASIYLWVFNYIIEIKQTSFNKNIESNAFQLDIFKAFLKDRLVKSSDRYLNDGFLVFSKAQLIAFLRNRLHKGSKRRPVHLVLAVYTFGLTLAKPRIDVESLENLADLILKKNLTKGTLQVYDSRSIDDLYKTNINEREINTLIND